MKEGERTRPVRLNLGFGSGIVGDFIGEVEVVYMVRVFLVGIVRWCCR